MFSAVNSPTPRVLFGMVVSGGGGVRLLGVGGCAQSGAVELSRPMGPLVCKAGQQRALAGCPVRAAKRAALSSRPSWVVLPGRWSVSFSTAEWLHYRRRHSWVRWRAAVVFLALSLLGGVPWAFWTLAGNSATHQAPAVALVRVHENSNLVVQFAQVGFVRQVGIVNRTVVPWWSRVVENSTESGP